MFSARLARAFTPTLTLLASLSVLSATHFRSLDKKAMFSCNALSITLVEMRRLELLTPCLQGRCSPN